jgi:hypothetical protein
VHAQVGVEFHRVLVEVAFRSVVEKIRPGECVELLELVGRQQLTERLVGACLECLQLGVEFSDSVVELRHFVCLSCVGLEKILVLLVEIFQLML